MTRAEIAVRTGISKTDDLREHAAARGGGNGRRHGRAHEWTRSLGPVLRARRGDGVRPGRQHQPGRRRRRSRRRRWPSGRRGRSCRSNAPPGRRVRPKSSVRRFVRCGTPPRATYGVGGQCCRSCRPSHRQAGPAPGRPLPGRRPGSRRDPRVRGRRRGAGRQRRELGGAGRATVRQRVDVDDFVYVHLGEGLGCAVVSDGEVTPRPPRGGRRDRPRADTGAVRSDRAVHRGVRRAGAAAAGVDGDRRRCAACRRAGQRRARRAGRGGARGRRVRVLLAAIAFGDPQLIVLGGSWAGLPPFVEALHERRGAWPRRLPVEVSALPESPELVAARGQAVEMLRSAIVETAREGSVTSERGE